MDSRADSSTVMDDAGAPGVAAQETQLQRGALGLTGVLMQALTNIAPAIAVLFTVPFIATNAGIAAPAAYLGAFVLSLTTALVLTQLTRHLPSAGSYYTFVSRAIHPRAGFLVAWVYFLFAPVVTAQVGTSMGSTLESALKTEWGFTFPWWLFTMLLIAFVGFSVYRGIKVSVELLVIFGVIELVIVGLFALWGFFDPGPGGVTTAVFDPGQAPTGQNTGFAIAVIFAIFALTGWDAAAPVAEESADPRRNVPRAILLAVSIMGLFLVVSSWGIISGWGPDRIGQFGSSEEPPYLVLAHQYWGGMWWLVLLALVNSALAVVISAANVATRLWYGMARSGALPSSLTRLHPVYRTPVNAVLVQTVVSIVIGLGAALLVGADKVYNVTGLMFTFVLIPVYVLGNIACFRLYRGEFRKEFNPFLHVIVPIISTAGLLAVGYKSLSPAPESPNNWAFPLVVVWAVIGVAVLLLMRSRGREAWLLRAGEAMADAAPESEPERVPA
jgi:amino acid transporter